MYHSQQYGAPGRGGYVGGHGGQGGYMGGHGGQGGYMGGHGGQGGYMGGHGGQGGYVGGHGGQGENVGGHGGQGGYMGGHGGYVGGHGGQGGYVGGHGGQGGYVGGHGGQGGYVGGHGGDGGYAGGHGGYAGGHGGYAGGHGGYAGGHGGHGGYGGGHGGYGRSHSVDIPRGFHHHPDSGFQAYRRSNSLPGRRASTAVRKRQPRRHQAPFQTINSIENPSNQPQEGIMLPKPTALIYMNGVPYIKPKADPTPSPTPSPISDDEYFQENGLLTSPKIDPSHEEFAYSHRLYRDNNSPNPEMPYPLTATQTEGSAFSAANVKHRSTPWKKRKLYRWVKTPHGKRRWRKVPFRYGDSFEPIQLPPSDMKKPDPGESVPEWVARASHQGLYTPIKRRDYYLYYRWAYENQKEPAMPLPMCYGEAWPRPPDTESEGSTTPSSEESYHDEDSDYSPPVDYRQNRRISPMEHYDPYCRFQQPVIEQNLPGNARARRSRIDRLMRVTEGDGEDDEEVMEYSRLNPMDWRYHSEFLDETIGDRVVGPAEEVKKKQLPALSESEKVRRRLDAIRLNEMFPKPKHGRPTEDGFQPDDREANTRNPVSQIWQHQRVHRSSGAQGGEEKGRRMDSPRQRYTTTTLKTSSKDYGGKHSPIEE